MFCTDKERDTCNVEKMGCKGCYYDNPNNFMKEKNKFLKELKDSLDKIPFQKEYIIVVKPQYYKEVKEYIEQYSVYNLDVVIREDLPEDVKAVFVDKQFFKNQNTKYEY